MFVLTLDGFSTAALSCYGSSWNPTPHLDRFAATGTIWDRAISPHLAHGGQFRAWMTHPELPARSITLVTDDAQWTRTSHADRLDEIILAESVCTQVAEQIEDTCLARLLAIAMTRLDDSEVIWLHSRFLTSAWDAPRDLFSQDEMDDPYDEEEPSALPPPPPIFDSLLPPQLRLTGEEHPDWVTAWMRTYGCQVRLVDSLLGVLASELADGDGRLVMPILVAGTSGFTLGQNGWIGHGAGPVRSCHLQVPLLTSHPGPRRDGSGVRGHGVISADDLVQIFRGVRELDAPAPIRPDQFAASADDQRVVSSDAEGPVAISTASWFFHESDEALFLKPDDVHDVNDVARLRPDVVEDLRQQLTIRNLPLDVGLQ